jgi:hypothetical protein
VYSAALDVVVSCDGGTATGCATCATHWNEAICVVIEEPSQDMRTSQVTG